MRTWVKIASTTIVVAGIAAGAFFFWPASLEPVTAQPTSISLVERGHYLATAADCEACHSVPGGKAFAGGLGFKLPFGTIYSPNITPDADTGIGTWTDAEFVRAMHKGIGKNGEDLYPAFPYASYALASTDDVLAIWAYLKTLAPVHQPTPANDLGFPFNQRYAMRAWKLLYLPGKPFEPDPAHDAVWNRGAYLADGLAHCGECHTPRTLLYGLNNGDKYAGAEIGGLKAYDITPDKTTGIGGWSDAELTTYLSTGHAEGHGAAMGTMGEAVDLSLRHLSDDDITAVAAYLRTVPARPSEIGGPVNPHPPTLTGSTPWSPPVGAPESAGLKIFQGACASCHGWDGTGQQVAHAALRGAHTVNDPDGTNLVRVILNGGHIDTKDGDLPMPSFGKAYTDEEVAAVSNYVIGQFGGKAGQVTPAQVAKARGS